ncbi:MAG: hypothetical protein ACFBSE_13780, partial [Prochloraceae cyanobacterium]
MKIKNRPSINRLFERNVIEIEPYVLFAQFDKFLNSEEKELSLNVKESPILPNFLTKRLFAKLSLIVKVIWTARQFTLAFFQGWVSQESMRSIAQISSFRHGVPQALRTKAGGTQSSEIDTGASRINKKIVQKSIFSHRNHADRNFGIKDRVFTNQKLILNLKAESCGGRISPEVWQGGVQSCNFRV